MTDAVTTYRKTPSGWKGETLLPLAFSIEGKPAELRLTTYANNPGIATYAAVQTRDGGFTTMRVFRDYHVCPEKSRDRATERAIRKQHERHVGELPTYMIAALSHHTEKGDVT